jgi:hypothetical protein
MVNGVLEDMLQQMLEAFNEVSDNKEEKVSLVEALLLE